MQSIYSFAPLISVFFLGLIASYWIYIAKKIQKAEVSNVKIAEQLFSISSSIKTISNNYVDRHSDKERHNELNNKIDLINEQLEKKVSRTELLDKINLMNNKMDNLSNNIKTLTGIKNA